MILSITLNPSVDRTLFVEKLIAGDTNRVLRTETDAGGKGVNVARVIAELGGEAVATGFVGGRTGLFIQSVLADEGVTDAMIEIAGETRLNISIENEKSEPPTTFNERGPTISPAEQELMTSKLEALVPLAEYVIAGGSVPPGIEDSCFADIVEMAEAKKCVVDADGLPMRVALKKIPWMVKPNLHEAERLIGKAGLQAARELHSMGVAFAVVSMGAEGAYLSCAQGDFFAKSAPIQSVSTIGSGDSLIGGFVFAHSQGESAEECLRWGTACGAATAMTNASEICRKPAVMEQLPRVEVKRL